MSTPTAALKPQSFYLRLSLTLLTFAVALTFTMFRPDDVASHPAPAPSISFVTAPGVLPRNQAFANYSPLVSIQYSGLEVGTYTLRVHLLETDPPGDFLCACAQSPQMWCPATFVIDNQSGNNSSGVIVDARITDVNDYQNLFWDADLLKENVEVATTSQAATSTLNRAPVLNLIGNKSVAVGQSLDFVVSASDPEGDALTLSAQNLPTGATFNNATGQFHWQPATTGVSSSVAFIATQVGASPLSDAELITLEVINQQPPGVLSLSTASNRIGEGGPAVLTVNRTNGSAGTVSVGYSTINGTAASGSDYTGVSGTVSFAAGEVSKTIRVNILNDSTVEPNETFQVVLSSPTGSASLGSPSQATVTIVDDDNPQLAGQWSSLITMPTVPIHMHVLPDGRVVFWDRHGDHANPTWDVTPYAWNPASPSTFTKLALPDWDIFCSGHTLTTDGRLFVAGGHVHDFVGAPTAGLYNPQTNTWTAVPNMNAGRWYPTTTNLPNGDLLVLAGTRTAYADINPIPQVFQPRSSTWRNLSNASSGSYPDWPDLYPFAYVAPNGKLFVAGPQRTARYLDSPEMEHGRTSRVVAYVIAIMDRRLCTTMERS